MAKKLSKQKKASNRAVQAKSKLKIVTFYTLLIAIPFVLGVLIAAHLTPIGG